MTLNITNGEYFNNFIKKEQPGLFIPFNETMLLGPVDSIIMSRDFINKRANYHKVSLSYYIDKLHQLENPDFINSFNSIILWFGNDTFCQINLLTILAYLDMIKYTGTIQLITIDDETMRIIEDAREIFCTNLYQTYLKVLVRKEQELTNYPVLNQAIKTYLDIQNEKDEISLYIKRNIKTNKNQLLIDCLNKSKSFGLSDLIILQLIEKYKNTKYYELTYHDVLIGELFVNNNICYYRPITNNIESLSKDNLLLNFLKNEINDVLENLPFFESRISKMISFNLKEISYPNDFYKLIEN